MPDDVAADEDDLDPEEAERQIDEFIAAAASLDGPPVDEILDAVLRSVAGAWTEVAAVVESLPNNKLIATMLAAGKIGRTSPPDSVAMWQANAASTFLSGMIGLGARNQS